jgi:ERCC4-related helicase
MTLIDILHACVTDSLSLGSGKTLISVLLIKHYLNLIRSTSNNTVTESVKSVESPRIVAEDTNAITRFDGGGFEKDCSNPPNPPPSKRVIAFVAPTKILVDQQRTYIAGNCNAVVRAYTSETVASLRDWAKQLAEVDVFVLTPEILRNALERKLLKVSSFALVILDECHNAMGKNPMSIVCELIKASEVRPRLLGLTGTTHIAFVFKVSHNQ